MRATVRELTSVSGSKRNGRQGDLQGPTTGSKGDLRFWVHVDGDSEPIKVPPRNIFIAKQPLGPRAHEETEPLLVLRGRLDTSGWLEQYWGRDMLPSTRALTAHT